MRRKPSKTPPAAKSHFPSFLAKPTKLDSKSDAQLNEQMARVSDDFRIDPGTKAVMAGWDRRQKRDFIRAQEELCMRLPSPEAVVQAFEDVLDGDFLEQLCEWFRTGPFSWTDRFMDAHGHQKVVVHLRKLVVNSDRFIVPNAERNVLIAGLERCLRMISSVPRGLACITMHPDPPTDMVEGFTTVAHYIELFCNLIHPQFVRTTTTALELVNLVLASGADIDIILRAIGEWESRRGYSDYVRLLLTLGTLKNYHQYDLAVLEFFGRILRSLGSRPEARISFCQRLLATGIREKFARVGQKDLKMDEWVNVLSHELEESQNAMVQHYGTSTAEPTRHENIYFALLTDSEQKARLAVGPLRIAPFKQPRDIQDASVTALRRLFLELTWLCGHQKPFAPFEYVLDLMRLVRFSWMACPLMSSIDAFRRVFRLINAHRRPIELRRTNPLAVAWQNAAGFFAGEEFFERMALYLCSDEFSPGTVSGQNCQTLVVLLDAALDIVCSRIDHVKPGFRRYFLESSGIFDKKPNLDLFAAGSMSPVTTGPPAPPIDDAAAPSRTVLKPNLPPPEKMRPLYWAKLPDSVAQRAIWHGIDEGKVALSIEELLRRFRAGGDVRQQSQVSFLTAERSRAFQALLSQFRAAPEELVKSVEALDPNLTEEQLKSLTETVPTDDEMATVRTFAGDCQLAEPELFVRQVGGFPPFRDYCEVMLLQRTADGGATKIATQLRPVCNAIQQVRGSQAFRYILGIVLKIGNVLNGGGRSGGAFGFKITSLTKLNAIRGAAPGVTLLTYLVRLISKQNPSALAVGHELSAVPAAAAVDLEQVRESYLAINGRYQKLKQKANMPPEFLRFAKALIGEVSAKIEEASVLINKATKEAKKILKDYGEDPRLMKSSDFFGAIATFLTQFAAAKLEQDKKQNEPPNVPAIGIPVLSPVVSFGDQQRGVMDDLLAKIRGGHVKQE